MDTRDVQMDVQMDFHDASFLGQTSEHSTQHRSDQKEETREEKREPKGEQIQFLLEWLNSYILRVSAAPFVRGRDIGAGETCKVSLALTQAPGDSTSRSSSSSSDTFSSSNSKTPLIPLLMPSGAHAAAKWSPLAEQAVFALVPESAPARLGIALTRALTRVHPALRCGGNKDEISELFYSRTEARELLQHMNDTRRALKMFCNVGSKRPCTRSTAFSSDARTEQVETMESLDDTFHVRSITWLSNTESPFDEIKDADTDTDTETDAEKDTKTNFLQLTQFWCQSAITCLISEFIAPYCVHFLESNPHVILLPEPLPEALDVPAARTRLQTQNKKQTNKKKNKKKKQQKQQKQQKTTNAVKTDKTDKTETDKDADKSKFDNKETGTDSLGRERSEKLWGVTLMERVHCTLDVLAPSMTTAEMRSVVFQVLVALHAGQTCIELKHHDLHADNVFLLLLDSAAWSSRVPKKLGRKLEVHAKEDTSSSNASSRVLPSGACFDYILGGRRFRVPHYGIVAKIGDYDQASARHPRTGSTRIMRADLELLQYDSSGSESAGSEIDGREDIWGPWNGHLVGHRGYDAQFFLGFLYAQDWFEDLPLATQHFLLCALDVVGGPTKLTSIGRPGIGAVSDVPPIALLLNEDLFGHFQLEDDADANRGKTEATDATDATQATEATDAEKIATGTRTRTWPFDDSKCVKL